MSRTNESKFNLFLFFSCRDTVIHTHIICQQNNIDKFKIIKIIQTSFGGNLCHGLHVKYAKERAKYQILKQPAWEAIKFGPKYLECPNRDCLSGKIYVNKYKSEDHNQYMPPDEEMAAQKA